MSLSYSEVKYLRSEAPPLESFHVVKDFVKVFPDYLNEIPPKHEINLSFDLFHDT